MNVTAEIEISAPRGAIWSAITDIANAKEMISSIISLEVLEQPDSGFVGLRWKETREMFGQESPETMWITDAIENEYYCTRAESHGSIYKTRLSLSERGENTLLTMSFTGEAQTLVAKVLSACMGIFIKGSMEKALQQDLEDIKQFVERA